MSKVIYNATQDSKFIYIDLLQFSVINWKLKFYIEKKHIKPIDEFKDLDDNKF